jgi:hypothetical protein
MPWRNPYPDIEAPFRPGRAYYNVLTLEPTWVYHQMASGSTLDGTAPTTAALTADQCDPVVTGGSAVWSALTHGGLLTQLGNRKQPMIIDAIDNPGSATLTLVHRDGTLSRNMPTSFPIKTSAGETIKASGGASGGKIGVLVRFDAEKVL